ncbi:MAG: hypothetical protein ACLU38_03155 [Dysosmobacter sp.]
MTASSSTGLPSWVCDAHSQQAAGLVNNQLSPFKEVFTLSDLDIMSVNADGAVKLHHRPCGGQQGRRAADSDGQRQEG